MPDSKSDNLKLSTILRITNTKKRVLSVKIFYNKVTGDSWKKRKAMILNYLAKRFQRRVPGVMRRPVQKYRLDFKVTVCITSCESYGTGYGREVTGERRVNDPVSRGAIKNWVFSL